MFCTAADFRHWWTSGSVLALGWLVHYVPYFLFSRVLFSITIYLPALPFKFMLLAAVCEHGHTLMKRWAGTRSDSSTAFPFPPLCLPPPPLPPPPHFLSPLQTSPPPLLPLSGGDICVVVLISFLVFAPFTYGYPALTQEQIDWPMVYDMGPPPPVTTATRALCLNTQLLAKQNLFHACWLLVNITSVFLLFLLRSIV